MYHYKIFTALAIIATALTPGAIFAYDSQAGIPTPPMCVDEASPAQPAAWPSAETANYYYVDNTSPYATDSSNTYGYPDKPRVSIPTTLSAGAVVEIHGGPYVASQRTFVANGTSSAPVWIRGGSANQKPILRFETIVNGSYVYLENLAFDQSRKTISFRYKTTGVDHACLRNSELSGPGTADGYTAVIGISGSSSDKTTDIVLYNNSIHDFGNNDISSAENDYHGVLPGAYAERVWVLNNTIYNNGGDAIQVGQANYSLSESPNYVYIGGNTFHGDRENGVDIKVSRNVIVSGNTMYDYRPTSTSAGEAVIVHDDPETIWVINNHIYDSSLGVVITGSPSNYVMGNVIHNINHTGSSWDLNSGYSSGAAIHMRGSTSAKILNNTLYAYDTGIQLTGGSNYEVEGNIFAGRTEPNSYDIRIANSTIASSSTLDFNLHEDPRVYWNGTYDISGLQSAYSSCLNCPPAAPAGFVNAAAADFTLLPNSPAIDKAEAPTSVYNLFSSNYLSSINYDLNGVYRPTSGSQEIGACEISGNIVYPPSPPPSVWAN